MSEFKKPDFKENSLELRFQDNEVCIYGTKEGLQKLSSLISKLIAEPKKGHIHLEDYSFLTNNSSAGVIALFKESGDAY